MISRVDQPTDWCGPLVTVQKSIGDARLYVDLTKFDEQVKSKCLVLPAVNDLLAQLSRAKLFSKLDANSGFYQPNYHLFDNFINTTFGLYWYNRLLIGITSALEDFQRRM